MATTATATNACDASIWLDNSGGTLTDISGSSQSLDVSFEMNIGEVRVFQEDWPLRTDCGKDASYTLTVVYTTVADEGFDILIDWYHAATPGARSFAFYMPDKNVGSDNISGEVRLASLSYTLTAGEGSPVLVTAELLPDGAQAHTVAST